MKIISYDGSMQEKSSMSVLLENDIKTEIIEHGKKTRPSWETFFKKLHLRHEDLSNIDPVSYTHLTLPTIAKV